MPAIYCDLDGTILDVWLRYYNVMRSFFLQQTNEPFISLEEYKRLKLSLIHDEQIINHVYRELSVSNKNLMKIYKNHKRLNLENPDLLESDTLIGDFHRFALLVKQKYCLVLVTLRKHPQPTIEQLKNLKIYDLIDDVIIVPPYPTDNPKLEALKGKTADEDIFIGDSKIDVECGAALGLQTFHVSTGLQSYEYATNHFDAIKLKNYMEVVQYL